MVAFVAGELPGKLPNGTTASTCRTITSLLLFVIVVGVVLAIIIVESTSSSTSNKR